MKRFFFALVALCALTAQVSAQKKYGEIKADTAKVRYVRNMDKAQSYIYDSPFRKNIILVNEEVTTHVIMPENIKLVDISTNKIRRTRSWETSAPTISCASSRQVVCIIMRWQEPLR